MAANIILFIFLTFKISAAKLHLFYVIDVIQILERTTIIAVSAAKILKILRIEVIQRNLL